MKINDLKEELENDRLRKRNFIRNIFELKYALEEIIPNKIKQFEEEFKKNEEEMLRLKYLIDSYNMT